MLITSISSFSDFFYSCGRQIPSMESNVNLLPINLCLNLTLSHMTNFCTLSNSKSLQTISLNLMKIVESSPNWSKLKKFADDSFRFNENGRMFSKWVENTVRKGEIARYEQFLLFPQCFQ